MMMNKAMIPITELTDQFFISINYNQIFEEYWSRIQNFLDHILNKTIFSDSYQRIFLNIKELCQNKCENRLYSNLSSYFTSYFDSIVVIILNSPDFSELLHDFWILLKSKFQLLEGIFRYFEVQHLKQLNFKSFTSFVLKFLTLTLQKNDLLIKELREKLLLNITKQRDNEIKELPSIISIIEIFIATGIYSDEFEQFYLNLSEEYYKEESKNFALKFDLRKFIDNLDKRFNEENNRNGYLEQITGFKIIKILENELIVNNLNNILEKGLEELIKSKEFIYLSKIYTYLLRVNKQEFLKKTWNYLIKERGKLLIAINSEDLIDNCIKLRNDLLEIVFSSFENSKIMKTAIDYAFEYFLNLKTNTIAEMTSKQMDIRLRKGGKNMNEELLKTELDNYFDLFRYISAKDVFEAFYNRRLAKRVLFGNISSQELENHVLNKLKTECGTGYTKKAEEIFKDIEISKQLNVEYRQFLLKNGTNNNNADIYVTVLHSNSWPLNNDPLNNLIEPFESLRNRFNDYYLSKQTGVMLYWQYEGSYCEVYGFFKGEKYLLNVSILQTMILILFNFRSSITYSEIKECIKIDEEELKKTLFSLYYMKEKFLFKSGTDQKNIEDSNEFKLNINYQSKLKMIKVNSVMKKETNEEIQETQNKVLQERQHLLDACIVRVIKGKKTLTHNDLVNEVFNDLKLPVSAQEIKKRIENLINRDYMTRDKNDFQTYHYSA